MSKVAQQSFANRRIKEYHPGNDISNSKPLGDFLRSRRYLLDPVALGISSTGRRRTPGLRREEVAARAGISYEWYVKLEQGRETSASDETITALITALELDVTDAKHLRNLAGQKLKPSFVRETVPDIVRAIVQSQIEPAYVTGARWDVLAWNCAADKLFGFSAMTEPRRNILCFMLTNPSAQVLFVCPRPAQMRPEIEAHWLRVHSGAQKHRSNDLTPDQARQRIYACLATCRYSPRPYPGSCWLTPLEPPSCPSATFPHAASSENTAPANASLKT